MPVADAELEKTDEAEAGLTEAADFGSNPVALRMLVFLPENLLPDAPLVVALHGCTQIAAAFDRACGWSNLASQAGFALLLPKQPLTNNSKGCFN
jgi:feruloyl esterase